jgi:phosphoribosyl 1,2-cyclic phosphodiesterase
MQVKIWGCRGSIAAPGADTVAYGGNTSCVEVVHGGESALILDAGSGIRALGIDLTRRGTRRIHLLLTHLHLDHLEGLRFFAPLWDARVTVEIWGPRSPVSSLRDRILRAFSPPLFPLDLRDVPARVVFPTLPKEPWLVEGVTLRADLVMHPGPTVGYRLESVTASVAYLPDHEPALAGIEGRSVDWISGGALAHGADLLLHDAQYLEDEYDSKIGWGHSTVDQAVAFWREVQATQLVLFHHDPDRSERHLDAIEDLALGRSPDGRPPPLVAREGLVIELAGGHGLHRGLPPKEYG